MFESCFGMFVLYFGTFDLGPGARMGRPCYVVISVMGNRATAVTADCNFVHVSPNTNQLSLTRDC